MASARITRIGRESTRRAAHPRKKYICVMRSGKQFRQLLHARVCVCLLGEMQIVGTRRWDSREEESARERERRGKVSFVLRGLKVFRSEVEGNFGPVWEEKYGRKYLSFFALITGYAIVLYLNLVCPR